MPRPALNDLVPRLPSALTTTVTGPDGEARSGPELHRDVLRAVTVLLESGVRAGCRVGILAPSGYRWAVADLACVAVGALSVPFDTARTREIDSLARRYKLTCVVTPAGAPPGRSPAHGCGVPASVPISELLQGDCLPVAGWEPHVFGENETYTVKFSSGTGANPKAVAARARHFDHMAANVADLFEFTADDRLLVVLPMSVYLQRTLVHIGLLTGMRVTIGRVERFPDLLRQHRPTIVGAVPHVLVSMLELHRRRRGTGRRGSLDDLWGGSVRCLWTGSAPIARPVLERYEFEGIPVFEGYGTTETGFIAKNTPRGSRLGSVGQLFPGVRVELDEDGQIVASGDCFPDDHYLDDDGHDDGGLFIGPGRVATGDVGRMDADGFLYLEGRLADALALANGSKVWPSRIEREMEASPVIAACVAVGHGRPYLVAVVAPASEGIDRAVLRREIELANERLAPHEHVRDFLVDPDLATAPDLRTGTGKIRRRAVADRYSSALDRLYG